MKLQGKNVVIVGGSTGIGFAAAKLAKQEGASVTIAGRSEEKLAQAQRELSDVRTIVADITDEALVGRVFEGLERVDHVFVTAGSLVAGKIVDADLSSLHRAVDERIWGPIYVVRSAVPRMTDGSITFMSGLLSSRPAPGTAITTAAVSALEALARALALEVAPVRVNAVAPGLIDTSLLHEAFGQNRDAIALQSAAALPVKRIGKPEEVAEAVVMLMTNGFINGEVLHIDGGGRYV